VSQRNGTPGPGAPLDAPAGGGYEPGVSLLEDRIFPWINDVTLGRRFDPIRARVAGAATGAVLEIGAGTGLNFPHYRPGVAVSAIEPAPGMRRWAARRGRVTSDVTLLEGRAKALPFDAGSFDTVVITFTLCSIKDEGVAAALAEVHRVLRPGGVVRLAEHVRSPDPARERTQRRVNPVWRVAFGGCTLLRDPRRELERAGFDVAGIEDVTLPLPGVARAGQIGVARRG
jgi:SAM-dependent methyltransferase